MIGYLSSKGMQKVFQDWAEADPNIKQFGYGNFYDQNGKIKIEQKYPGMYVQPINSIIDGNTIRRSYQIIIYDVPFESVENENDIVSDCEEYAFRLNRFLSNKSDTFLVFGQPVITPFRDKFLDDVSGVMIDITIEFNGDLNDCNDPDYLFNINENNI
jgi:hypothetical protein